MNSLKHLFRNLLLITALLFSLNHVQAQKKYTLDSYINTHSELAAELMEETGVPASVILGIAIHESFFGNSRIARHLHNHFGIKGKNNSKTIKSAFKGYGSVDDSYKDFVGLLQRRRATKKLFKELDHESYKGWVLGIARAGYSETTDWSRKVLSLIETYDLHDFDKIDPSPKISKLPLIVLPEIRSEQVVRIFSFSGYTVQPGDTLEDIAESVGVSIQRIKKINNIINDEDIIIGQRLFV